jgi:Glycosyltransferase
MTVFYLGQFPPPFGGVTVKNALLSQALSERMAIRKLEFRKEGTLSIATRVLFSKSDDVFLVGFGNRHLQRLFVKTLGRVRPSVLKRLIIVVMGGEIPLELRENKRYARFCDKARAVYFETEGMMAQAREAGLSNVRLFPNCRHRPEQSWAPRRDPGAIKAVCFSLIDESKGSDLVLEAAAQTPQIEYHFYGPVAATFLEEFQKRVTALPNVVYHGIFDSVEGDACAELNGYDIHLFPTRCRFEGVPGVLVETKIAAVPSVVSDVSFNAEIVEDGVSGLVLRGNTVEELVSALKIVDGDREFLSGLKKGALESAEYFYLDGFIDQICADILGLKEGDDG